MRRLMLFGATFLMLTVYPLVSIGKAQTRPGGRETGRETTPSGRETGTESGKQTTVTGCLQKGDQANEYRLTTEEGKRYDLMGSNLAPHVGHTITVTGTPASEEKEERGGMEKGGRSEPGGRSEAGAGPHLNVSKVQMVSSSCR